MGSLITLDDVREARARIAAFVIPTPVVLSRWLSSELGAEVLLKLETFQTTGSFKIRGAANRMAVVAAAGEGRGVVAVSAGNHARAVAECAERLDLATTIVMPRSAAPTKIAAVRRYRVEVLLEGDDYDAAERAALALARERGAEFVSPYNDRHVIAGQGTVALEIVEQAGVVDALLVPAGGGGLLAGVAVAARTIDPPCEVVGAQPAAAATLAACFAAGRQVDIPQGETIADGLSGNLEPGSITVPIVLEYVTRFCLVSEVQIAEALRGIVDNEHVLAEPSAAVAVAALLADRDRYRGRRVAVVLSGANVGPERLRQIL